MLRKWIERGLCAGLLLSSMSVFPVETKYPSPLPTKAHVFIEYMVKCHHFNRTRLTDILSEARYNEDVIYRITHPYEAKPWNIYRACFLTIQHIQHGLHYWKMHEEVLRYAEHHYGIPPSIIVAIIGIESNYGAQVGEFSALDALTTLAFHYKKREKFFTRELVQLFLLVKEQKLAMELIKSSYAGAIGIPQFMPSTYRHYQVVYSKNAHIDLIKNDDDAIVSIANFLNKNGWKNYQPIACKFTAIKPFDLYLISKDAIPKEPINLLKKMGIIMSCSLPVNQKAAIVQLKGENTDEYWLTLHNFHVIMQYNPRITYAMAVYQLSQAIQKQHEQHIARKELFEHTLHTPTSGHGKLNKGFRNSGG